MPADPEQVIGDQLGISRQAAQQRFGQDCNQDLLDGLEPWGVLRGRADTTRTCSTSSNSTSSTTTFTNPSSPAHSLAERTPFPSPSIPALDSRNRRRGTACGAWWPPQAPTETEGAQGPELAPRGASAGAGPRTAPAAPMRTVTPLARTPRTPFTLRTARQNRSRSGTRRRGPTNRFGRFSAGPGHWSRPGPRPGLCSDPPIKPLVGLGQSPVAC